LLLISLLASQIFCKDANEIATRLGSGASLKAKLNEALNRNGIIIVGNPTVNPNSSSLSDFEQPAHSQKNMNDLSCSSTDARGRSGAMDLDSIVMHSWALFLEFLVEATQEYTYPSELN